MSFDNTEYCLFQPLRNHSFSSSSSCFATDDLLQEDPQSFFKEFSSLLNQSFFLNGQSFLSRRSQVSLPSTSCNQNSLSATDKKSDLNRSSFMGGNPEENSSFNGSLLIGEPPSPAEDPTVGASSLEKETPCGNLALGAIKNVVVSGCVVEEKDMENIYENVYEFYAKRRRLMELKKSFCAFAHSLYEEEEKERTQCSFGSAPYSFLQEYFPDPLLKQSQCSPQRLAALVAPVDWDHRTSEVIQQLVPLSTRICEPDAPCRENTEKMVHCSCSMGSSRMNSIRNSSCSESDPPVSFSLSVTSLPSVASRPPLRSPSSLSSSSLLNTLIHQVWGPLKEQKHFLQREITDIQNAMEYLKNQLPPLASRKKKRNVRVEERVRSSLLADLKLERQIEVEKLKGQRQALEAALANVFREKVVRQKAVQKGRNTIDDDNEKKVVWHSRLEVNDKEMENDADMKEERESEELEKKRVSSLQAFLSSSLFPQVEKLWKDAIQCPSPSSRDEPDQELVGTANNEDEYKGEGKEHHRALFNSQYRRRTTRGGISGVLEEEGWYTVHRAILFECWSAHPFYRLYGGATESHLKSKPLHTFLKSLRYIHREAYIQEEVLRAQLSSSYMTPSQILEEALLKRALRRKKRGSNGELCSRPSFSSTATTVASSVSSLSSQEVGCERHELYFFPTTESLLSVDYSVVLDFLDQHVLVSRVYQPWKREAEVLLGAQCRVLEYLLFLKPCVMQFVASLPKNKPEEIQKEEANAVRSTIMSRTVAQQLPKNVLGCEKSNVSVRTRNEMLYVIPISKQLKKLQLEWYVPEKQISSGGESKRKESSNSLKMDASISTQSLRTTHKAAGARISSSVTSLREGPVRRYLLRCFLHHEEWNLDEVSEEKRKKIKSRQSLPLLVAQKSSGQSEEDLQTSLGKTVSWVNNAFPENCDTVSLSSADHSSQSSLSSCEAERKNSIEKNLKEWRGKAGGSVTAPTTKYSANVCLSQLPVLFSTAILISNPQLQKGYERWIKKSLSYLPHHKGKTKNGGANKDRQNVIHRSPNNFHHSSDHSGIHKNSLTAVITVGDCIESGLVQAAFAFTPEAFQQRRQEQAALQTVKQNIRTLQEELAEILEDNFNLEKKISELQGRNPVRWSERPSLALWPNSKD